MTKIGRNDTCPCGSGVKYKKCCAQKKSALGIAKNVKENREYTLTGFIKRIQCDAASKRVTSFEFGVFFFFADSQGNAWMLEMTDGDAIQLTENGKALSPSILENSERIEVNWSHKFIIKKKQSLTLTSYEDERESTLESAPVSDIYRAMRRIKKRLSQRDLDKLHIS